jgi:hypothetical protein
MSNDQVPAAWQERLLLKISSTRWKLYNKINMQSSPPDPSATDAETTARRVQLQTETPDLALSSDESAMHLKRGYKSIVPN